MATTAPSVTMLSDTDENFSISGHQRSEPFASRESKKCQSGTCIQFGNIRYSSQGSLQLHVLVLTSYKCKGN